MKPEPLKDKVWKTDRYHNVDMGKSKDFDIFLFKDVKSAVQGLLEEISRLDYEMMLGDEWKEFARTQEFADFVFRIKQAVRKWFADVVVEDENLNQNHRKRN